MVDTIAIVGVTIAALAVATNIWRTRGDWTRAERHEWRQRVEALERQALTVDERIKDAAHARVKMATFIQFSEDTRQRLENMAFAMRDGLHERAKKTELDELRRELRGKIR